MTTLMRSDYPHDVVVGFPRDRILRAELNHEQTLRRCRLAAKARGCTHLEIAAVERNAIVLLELEKAAHDVVIRSEELAQLIVSRRPAP